MKKRRPSHENPYYDKKYKSENAADFEMDLVALKIPKRYCREENCKELLPPDRYFHCKKCEKSLPFDSGVDSLYYKK